jgi:hypothetical protein
MGLMGLMTSLDEFIDRLRIKLFDFEMLTGLMVLLMLGRSLVSMRPAQTSTLFRIVIGRVVARNSSKCYIRI